MSGLGKKVLIANNIGALWDAIAVLPVDGLAAGTAWLGALAYTFQIYFDFSGYSDMAIGLGKMFGFHFLENFNYPYISKSITEFWRRWHISLSSWFKEYVYIPLGGNRCKIAKQIRNILAVWLFTGLWHGASWHYVAWGLWHGGLIILSTLFTPWWERTADRLGVPRRAAWYRVLQGIRTFALVCLGYVFFRSSGMAQSLAILRGLLDVQPGSLGGGRLFQLGLDQPDFWAAALSTAALLAVAAQVFLGARPLQGMLPPLDQVTEFYVSPSHKDMVRFTVEENGLVQALGELRVAWRGPYQA